MYIIYLQYFENRVDCKSKRAIFYPQRAFTITNVRVLCQFTYFENR